MLDICQLWNLRIMKFPAYAGKLLYVPFRIKCLSRNFVKNWNLPRRYPHRDPYRTFMFRVTAENSYRNLYGYWRIERREKRFEKNGMARLLPFSFLNNTLKLLRGSPRLKREPVLLNLHARDTSRFVFVESHSDKGEKWDWESAGVIDSFRLGGRSNHDHWES